MDFVLDIFNYIVAASLIGISGTWIFLIKTMTDSFRLTPYLDRFENTSKENPKVSIILPARNEEEHIGKCLDSLINQDYQNYEIIVIDDSSEDTTGEIITEYAEKHEKVISVTANPNQKDGWVRIGHVWKDIKKHQENYYYLQMQIQNIRKR